MSIDENGFLSKDIAAYQKIIKEKYAVHFDFVKRIDRFCNQTKFHINAHNRDGQEVFAACLFLKLLADVEGAVLLLERGLGSQAGSLIRIATEAVINLAKICQSYEFVEAFIRISERQRLKLVRGMKSNPALAFDAIRPDLTDELIDRIVATIGDCKDENLRQWACDVGLSALYDAQYRVFSSDVHSRPRSLERYLVTNEEGEMIEFKWGPDKDENLSPELIETARLLITGLHYIGKLFALNLESDVKQFTAELEKLVKQAE